MARGATARRTRSKKRAAARSQAQGVNEALDLTSDADVFTTRQRSRLALVAAGVSEPDLPIQTTYDLSNGTLTDRTFLAETIKAGFTEARRSAWPSEGLLEDHGEVLARSENEGVFRLEDGSIAHVSLGYGWFEVRVAAPSRDVGIDAVAAFSAKYPPLYRDQDEDDSTVPITFWTNSKHGPVSRLRIIDSASWEAIEGNYTSSVREELGSLMSDKFQPGKDGQLLLWQGSPGTGKTWALRALASEWSSWAEFSYITDPDSFFVSDPSYMIDVLLHESYETLTVDDDVVTDSDPQGKWRVLILEDTGELLSANAKESYGQGLSRLLNVVDGMVGQGLRVLALVTTNDELGDLHPAVVRPGRCASQLEFGPLTVEEANGWLASRSEGSADPVEAPASLAELYEIAGDAAEAMEFGVIPADADYRESTGTETCSTCSSFSDGQCSRWDAAVEGDYVCNDWEAQTAASLAAANPPMSGECADCGHSAMSHYGDMNDGACSIEGCACDGMVESQTASVQQFLPFTLTTSGTNINSTQAVTLTNFKVTPFVDLPAEHLPGATLPSGGDIVPPEMPAQASAGLRWTAIFAPEGKATDDGRIFAPGSITWRELPLSLMAMTKTADGHDGAEVCGRIDAIWRDDETGLIRASGEFDGGEFGIEIGRLVGEGTLRGVSVDIAVSEMEIAYRSEVVDGEGVWVEHDVEEADEEESDGPSMIDVLFGEDEDVLFVVRKGVIGASTVCPFPAFADACIELAASLTSAAMPNVWTVTSQAAWTVTSKPVGADLSPSEEESDHPVALTASAAGIAPERPPADWFEDPEFEELTGLTVDDDGFVYGHAAAWDTCHIGIPGVCTTAPHSHSDYAYFHLKEVLCDDGSRVSCGTVTLDAPHAGRDLGRADASAHYDHTGTATADVVVGEDAFGIWVTGALRSDVDVEKARKLRGSVLSGDWRDVNGNLELIGLLAVNVPGFPVPRTRALVASGLDGNRVLTLVAAGIHADGQIVPGVLEHGLSRLEGAQLEALSDVAAGKYDALKKDSE